MKADMVHVFRNTAVKLHDDHAEFFTGDPATGGSYFDVALYPSVAIIATTPREVAAVMLRAYRAGVMCSDGPTWAEFLTGRTLTGTLIKVVS